MSAMLGKFILAPITLSVNRRSLIVGLSIHLEELLIYLSPYELLQQTVAYHYALSSISSLSSLSALDCAANLFASGKF